ncbi:MAG: hypothetical protein LBT81_02965 [Helicobacteraceae bacterium]|jgi:hypothetical protein|nr:hypothetical protein [Helicobacteraceae bacterium]
MTVEITVFRFNARFDYLSSYKPYVIQVKKDQTLAEMLTTVKERDTLFTCDLERVDGVRLCGWGAGLDVKAVDIVSRFGKKFVVEPLDTKRALLDLEIDSSDFDSKLSIFDNITAEDICFYNQYKMAYYLSPVRVLNPYYLGEAVFMLADRLIRALRGDTSDLLRRICDAKNGIFSFCSLHRSLVSGAREIALTVRTLQEMALELEVAPKGARAGALWTPSIWKLPSLEGKTVALLLDETADLPSLKAKLYGAKVITMKNSISGVEIGDLLPEIAVKAGARLLLEAQESGAEALLCSAREAAEFLRKNYREIARSCNQPLDIPVL